MNRHALAQIYYDLLGDKPFKSWEYITWVNDNIRAYEDQTMSKCLDTGSKEFLAFVMTKRGN